MAKRSTTAQWMRERGYDRIWKSALNPEARRKFKLARALVERHGTDLDAVIGKLERRAKELRTAKETFETGVRALEEMKKMVNGWGRK